MKSVIVNADEFGLTDKVNEAVLKAHKYGIVSSTTLVVNAQAFENAVRIAKSNPSLGVGLHLNLTFGRPLSKAAALVNQNGLFLKRRQLSYRLLSGRADIRQVEEELRAQVNKFLESGLELSHLDSHQYIQLHPSLMRTFIKMAKENNVPIRIPADVLLFENKGLLSRFKAICNLHFAKHIIVLSLCWYFRKIAQREGVRINDFFLSPHGVYRDGMGVSAKTFLSILDEVKDGYTEIMCHPGIADQALTQISKYAREREDELNALTDAALKKAVSVNNIRLINYKKLNEEKKRVKVLHVITRSIEGGAPENTFLTMQGVDRKKFNSSLACGGNGPLVKRAKADGFECCSIPGLDKEVNPVLDLIALISLWRLIRKNKFDIVHTHASKAGILGRIAAKMAGAPVIIHTIHGFGFNDYQSAFTRYFFVSLERLCAKFTDKIIAVSNLNIEKARRFNIGTAGQFVAVHSGIVVEKFSGARVDKAKKKKETGIKNGSRVIGMVGHVDEGKGHEYLIEAARKVLAEIPDVQFLIIGDGKLSEKIKGMISKYRLDASVIMLGVREDVPELYSIMDVFTLPTLWEGLPRVIPEAMAAGLPIVTTPVDGIPEAITDNVNGLLVPPRDPERLAQALVYILKNPDRAGEFGRQARKRVYPDFSAEKMVKDIQKVYEGFICDRIGAMS